MVKIWQKLRESQLFFMLLFLIPTTIFLIGLDWTWLNVLFVVATEITLAHAVYVGYSLFRQQEKMNYIQYSLLGTLWLGMFILFCYWQTIQEWFLILISVLLVGIFFNVYTRKVSNQYNVREFCRRKIYVDLIGIILGIGGIIFVKVSQHYILLGILNALIILLINYLVFFEIRLFNDLKS